MYIIIVNYLTWPVDFNMVTKIIILGFLGIARDEIAIILIKNRKIYKNSKNISIPLSQNKNKEKHYSIWSLNIFLDKVNFNVLKYGKKNSLKLIRITCFMSATRLNIRLRKDILKMQFYGAKIKGCSKQKSVFCSMNF